MAKKINLYTIQKQLNDLAELFNELRPHQWYEPSIYIKNFNNIERIWKHNNTYYPSNKRKQLYNVIQPSVSETTFYKYLNDSNDPQRLFSMGIQPEYVKLIPQYNIYICTDGEFLHKNFTPYTHQPFSSGIVIYRDGNPIKLSRSTFVFKTFVDSRIEQYPFFRDGNLGNCRIDNLEYHESEWSLSNWDQIDS